MRLRVTGLWCCLLALASACGGGGGVGALTREVTAALDRTRDNSRTYRYIDQTIDGKRRIDVEGKIQDDLRYSGTVSVNGKKLYQEIVSDDSVALRILDLKAAKPVIDAAQRADPITAEALRTRRWVVDHAVAPPLLAAAAAPANESEDTADDPASGLRRPSLVGDDPFTDAAQLINYADRAARGGIAMERFDPEGIDYNALDDPWTADAQIDLEELGLRRYDLTQPPLPAPAERGKRQSLPQVEHFRKMAVYVETERVVKIREQISIGDRREFRRAEQGRTAGFYLKLRDEARKGGVQDELRERKMEYVVTKIGDVAVTLPRNAEKGLLAQVLPALKSLFGFEFIGGRTGPALPGVKSPAPGGSPVASPASRSVPSAG